MAHVVTLSEQLDTVVRSVQPLIDRSQSDDLLGAYGQAKAAVAECEALLSLLKQEVSTIEYEMLENNEDPTEYWNI